jgi:hypothetical protein
MVLLPGSRSRITLTLRQLWWGMLSAAMAMLIVTPFLGVAVGLTAACNVVLVTAAAFEVDHRGYFRVSAHTRLTLLGAAAASALLTLAAGVWLLRVPLGTAGVAAGLTAVATVLSIVVLGRVFALFRRRETVIVVT